MGITCVVVWLEAVFRLQTQLDVANNIQVVIFQIEEEDVEIEITILTSESSLHKVGSTTSVLESGYMEVFE